MAGEHRLKIPVRVIQERSDLGQTEAQAAQRQNAIQAGHILLVIEPVPSAGPSRGTQQSSLVVVPKRAYGDTAQFGKLTHAPLSRGF